MYMYGEVCAHECRPEEGIGSPGDGAIGGCEPPRVGAGG